MVQHSLCCIYFSVFQVNSRRYIFYFASCAQNSAHTLHYSVLLHVTQNTVLYYTLVFQDFIQFILYIESGYSNNIWHGTTVRPTVGVLLLHLIRVWPWTAYEFICGMEIKLKDSLLAAFIANRFFSWYASLTPLQMSYTAQTAITHNGKIHMHHECPSVQHFY